MDVSVDDGIFLTGLRVPSLPPYEPEGGANHGSLTVISASVYILD